MVEAIVGLVFDECLGFRILSISTIASSVTDITCITCVIAVNSRKWTICASPISESVSLLTGRTDLKEGANLTIVDRTQKENHKLPVTASYILRKDRTSILAHPNLRTIISKTSNKLIKLITITPLFILIQTQIIRIL